MESKSLYVQVPDELMVTLKVKAATSHLSMRQLVVRGLAQFLQLEGYEDWAPDDGRSRKQE